MILYVAELISVLLSFMQTQNSNVRQIELTLRGGKNDCWCEDGIGVNKNKYNRLRSYDNRLPSKTDVAYTATHILHELGKF